MALTQPRAFNEFCVSEGTTSIATTPVAMQLVAPVAGYVSRVIAAAGGATTTATTVAVTINGGSDITGGALVIPIQAAAGNGVVVQLPLVGASAVWVNEGDFILATPSGGTGASIPGAVSVVIRGIV